MNGGYSQIFFIAIIAVVFYFLIIRPQQQRTKQQREMLSSLNPGDEIVTIGGIFATVVDVDERLTVRLKDGTELEIAKQAVGQVLPAGSSAGDAEDVASEDDEGAEESDAPAQTSDLADGQDSAKGAE